MLKIPQKTVVYLPRRKRGIFDKTMSFADYQPNPLPPSENRKPRLPQWDDPDVVWPPLIPKATKLRGKALLRQIEDEEKEKFQLLKPYNVPEIRSGDIIKFHYLHSISEGGGNEYTGLCIGVAQPNSLNANFWVLMKVAGQTTMMNVKLHSPFLVKLELLKKGSGNHNKKLFYLTRNMKQNAKFLTPMIKNKIKPRKGEKKKNYGKVIDNTVVMDKIAQ